MSIFPNLKSTYIWLATWLGRVNIKFFEVHLKPSLQVIFLKVALTWKRQDWNLGLLSPYPAALPCQLSNLIKNGYFLNLKILFTSYNLTIKYFLIRQYLFTCIVGCRSMKWHWSDWGWSCTLCNLSLKIEPKYFSNFHCFYS